MAEVQRPSGDAILRALIGAEAPEPELAAPPGMFEHEPEPPPDVVEQLHAEQPPALVRWLGPQIAQPLPEQKYLIRSLGMVAGGGAPHMIAGYGFSGKTLALQVMLLCLAAGRPVWGTFDGPGDPIRVGHVDMEQGQALTFRRYQRAAVGHRLDLAEDAGDRLCAFVMPKVGDRRLTLQPEHRAVWQEIMSQLEVVGIDSLAALSGDVEENSRGQRAGLDMLGDLSEQTGCRPLVLHHATKPPAAAPVGDRASRYSIRGSGAIYDALDSAYVFSGEKGEAVKVEHVKARSHGEPVEDFALVFGDVAEGDDPKAGVTVKVHGAELIGEQREARAHAREAQQADRDGKRVTDALRAAGSQGLCRTELAADTGLNGARLTAAVRSLKDKVSQTNQKEGRVWKSVFRVS